DPSPEPCRKFRYEPKPWAPPQDEPAFQLSGLGPQEGLLTVERGDGPIAARDYHDDQLVAGPSIVDWTAVPPSPVRLDRHPRRGAHIDVPDRTVGIWTLDDYGALVRSWDDIWPGWALLAWEDRSEEQVSRARGALVLPEPDLAAAREDFADRLDFFWLTGV